MTVALRNAGAALHRGRVAPASGRHFAMWEAGTRRWADRGVKPLRHFVLPPTRAFTLIELLTVIAIVGILAAILIPTVMSSRVSADRARTKIQFNQWATAIESFRSEYGYYPVFDSSNLVNGGANTTDHPFHDVLAGRKRDGAPLTAGSAAATQNRKAISFYSFPESEFTDASSPAPNLLRDATGNTEIAVLVDSNRDGVINSSDFGASLPLVSGISPAASDFPDTGVRSGVVFYTLAPGASATDPQFIFSWK